MQRGWAGHLGGAGLGVESRIERLRALPADRVAPLITASEQSGLRFVRRVELYSG